MLFHLYLPGRTPPSEHSAFFRLRRPSDSTCRPRGKSRTFSDAGARPVIQADGVGLAAVMPLEDGGCVWHRGGHQPRHSQGHVYRYDASDTLCNRPEMQRVHMWSLRKFICSRSVCLCMRAQGTDTSEASVIEQNAPAKLCRPHGCRGGLPEPRAKK